MYYLPILLVLGWCSTGLEALDLYERNPSSFRSSLDIFGVSLESTGFNSLSSSEIKTIPIENLKNLLFYTNVSIGSPSQHLSLVIYSATSDLWAYSTKCKQCSGDRYDSNASSTYESDGRSVEFIEKVTQFKMNGILSVDNICVADLCDKSQYFVESLSSAGNIPFNGILGLGMSTKASYNSTSFLKNQVNTKSIGKMIYGFWLNRTLSPNNNSYELNGGELHLGGVNSKRFVENITWVPTTSNTSWEIRVDQITNGKGDGIACVRGCTAKLLLGVPGIVGPIEEINTILDFIGATEGQIPCDTVSTLPEIAFYIGDTPLILKGVDYIINLNGICFPAFMASKGSWAIGTPVLGSHYTIYDEDQLRFGFAKLANNNGDDKPSTGLSKPIILLIGFFSFCSVIAIVAIIIALILKCYPGISTRSDNYREYH